MIFVIRKPDGTLAGQAIDADLDAFPLNTIQVLNFSKHKLNAQIAGKAGLVNPSKSGNFRTQVEKHKASVPFAPAAEIRGQARLIREAAYPAFTRESRLLLLVYNQPNRPNKIVYQTFRIRQPIEVENQSDEQLKILRYE